MNTQIKKSTVLFALADLPSEAPCNNTLFFQDEVRHALRSTALTHMMSVT